MTNRFLKLNLDSDEADFLALNHPNAFMLLYFIARRARRVIGLADGLTIGQCHLGDYKSYGLTERKYRTAKNILVQRKTIKIIETCRTRKKSTTGTTTVGTLVQLLDSKVWDINPEVIDDRNDDRPTTDRRPTDDEQDRRRKKKNEKEDHPSIPSFVHNSSDDGLIDDFSSEKEKIEIIPGVLLSGEELDACVKLKGNVEKVKVAIEFIQASSKRRHPITDWPNALAKWKVQNKTQIRLKDHMEYSEKLCREFPDYEDGNGWRCYMYTDRNKDLQGILFESQSPYLEPFFVPLIEHTFPLNCEEFIKTKNMRKK